MKPGEHQILGCGVYVEPEEVIVPYEVEYLFSRFKHQVWANEAALKALQRIRDYTETLQEMPHSAAMSPKNIAHDLLKIFADIPNTFKEKA